MNARNFAIAAVMITLASVALVPGQEQSGSELLSRIDVDAGYFKEGAFSLNGRLMTGSEVANILPFAAEPLSSVNDVYFVGYMTINKSIGRRLLFMRLQINVDDYWSGYIEFSGVGIGDGARQFVLRRLIESPRNREGDREKKPVEIAKDVTRGKVTASVLKMQIK